MKFKAVFFIGVFALFQAMFLLSCKNSGPSTPYDVAFTPTPVRIYGSVNVFVQDKGLAVPNLTVQAIPPSGVTVYSQPTTTSGIASFNPPYLEIGNWTFVVPAQTPFPFAPSTLTMPVTVANETANFDSAGATIQLTPPVPSAYSSTNGGVFVYGVVYNQPGSLLVPVQMALPSLPSNWSGVFSPVTFGNSSSVTGTVTLTGASCVDSSPSFSVTALDFEPTPYPRDASAPQTITKNFTSNVTVTWTTTGLNSDFCNNGDLIGIVYGTIKVSSTNACSSDDVVSISLTTGSCCYSQFQTPNGSPSASNCGGGSVNFGPGSYNCTIDTVGTWGVLNCSFKGQSNSVAVPLSGSVQLQSVNY